MQRLYQQLYAKVMADAVPVPIALGHVAQSFHDLGMSELQQLRECNANQAEQIRTLNAAFTELAGRLIAAEAEDRRLRSLLNCVEDDCPAVNPVQIDIDRTLDHLLNGRTTKTQRRDLNTATERAERVSPATDAAIGRALSFSARAEADLVDQAGR